MSESDNKPTFIKNESQFETEAELALCVENYLKSQGWQVFKEVKPNSLSSIADIVAVKDKKIWIIETKLQYGTKVLDQAYKWKNYAHYVSIAVPTSKHVSFVLDHFLNHFGLGKIFVYPPTSTTKGIVSIKKEATFKKDVVDLAIWNSLHIEQKDSIAGSKGGGYVTPYKLTIAEVKQFLKFNPKSSIDQIVSKIKHHYTSNSIAANNLSKMLVEVETDFIVENDKGKKLFSLKK